MQKRILMSIIISVGIIAYVYFMMEFFAQNFWWIVPAYLYVVYFFIFDFSEKRKHECEAFLVRDCRDVRIGFW